MIFSFLTITSSCKTVQHTVHNALICYGDFYPNTVSGLDYVVVEPQLFSPEDVSLLKTQNKKVLAYISLGEVNAAAVHYQEIKKETLQYNEIWNSYVIDIAAPQTREALFSLIEEHLAVKKFDGLFLDNLDNYTSFGPTPNNKAALVSFLKELKVRFRESVLMQNAGLQIVDATEPYIDIVAVESVASDYNFETQQYQMRSNDGFEERLNSTVEIRDTYNLPILLIEYADSQKLRTEILNRLKPYQFDVFVGQIDLQKIPEFRP
ncbi:Glycoside-hydrolase family GH114 [Nonlabens sp. Hel1_33_55]|uniref:endo alpha-1,4 polygalactosaminidase n=1 Tax=Nonlabens sp. Hel1_33_55 TaxID=1336802 RepID=UPI000875D011|nr:endo alpha-1,4 polygalactosaminidase [Nonlabens sp. Hel1_33_55]SCY17924.1 Glycoside-hydrolase family GH114 [Nonlabens sp. Hel1_33_55]